MLQQKLYEASRALYDLTADEARDVTRRMLPRDRAYILYALQTDWASIARPKQLLVPGSWRYNVWLAGRMWGKTLAGAQAIRQAAESGEHEYLSMCGPTVNNTHRDMLTGPSGLLTISPRWYLPEYVSTKNQVFYPRHPITGVRPQVTLLSADRPDRIRGSQCSFLWADEPQSWTKPQSAFEMLDMTLRLGKHPQGVISMTPKDNPFTRDLILGPMNEKGKRTPRHDVKVVRGTTFENVAIAADALESLKRTYEGSSIGRQELYAEIIEKPDAALWIPETINKYRVQGLTVATKRTVVAVDPSRSPIGIRDLCGIVVGALGSDGHVYIYKDASTRGGPLQWAQRAVSVALEYRADAIVYEANAVSADIQKVIRVASEQSGTHWKAIFAKGTKQMRAEPVAALYMAGRVHHVGIFEHLEDEMTGWDPALKDSPDRMDALVHVCTELALGHQGHALAVR